MSLSSNIGGWLSVPVALDSLSFVAILVKKGKRDQDSDSSDNEGNAYFVEALVVVRNDEMTELVMDSGDNRTCTIKGTGKVKIQLHDGSSFISKDVRIKVIKGCRVMMTGIRKKNCVYTLEAKVMTFGVQKHGGSKQVRLKQLGSKQVRELKGIVKLRFFQVSNDDASVTQRQLEEKQLKEKTNTNCLVKKQEKGNVAKKKKVKESMEANLGKLLKYNAWSTRWSPIRGSSTVADNIIIMFELGLIFNRVRFVVQMIE
ncbi:hypothetical protein Tco_0901898 [Tanacetum coccineum]